MPCPTVLPPDALCAMEPNACYMWSDRLKLGMALEWGPTGLVAKAVGRAGPTKCMSKLASNPCF